LFGLSFSSHGFFVQIVEERGLPASQSERLSSIIV
jgi:hypothetical protein